MNLMCESDGCLNEACTKRNDRYVCVSCADRINGKGQQSKPPQTELDQLRALFPGREVIVIAYQKETATSIHKNVSVLSTEMSMKGAHLLLQMVAEKIKEADSSN